MMPTPCPMNTSVRIAIADTDTRQFLVELFVSNEHPYHVDLLPWTQTLAIACGVIQAHDPNHPPLDAVRDMVAQVMSQMLHPAHGIACAEWRPPIQTGATP